MLFEKKKIYMDFAATTPVLPEINRVMEKYWSREFYNPSSIYNEARRVRNDIEECREHISRSLGARKQDVIFTSGGTESSNLAILGAFAMFRKRVVSTIQHNKLSIKPHLIISAIEHPSVNEVACEIERRGGSVSIAPVDSTGKVAQEAVLELIKPSTFLISVMLANNEIGTIEPVSKIGSLVRDLRREKSSEYPYLHTDASQAPNYIEVNAEKLRVDLITIDSSKIYGPKGIGALIVRPTAKLHPIIFGGGQESGLRSGTENPALIVGFTHALLMANNNRAKEVERVRNLRKYFIEKIKNILPRVEINGDLENSLPNIISISIPGKFAELVVLAMEQKGILISAGSACSSLRATNKPSVIEAIGKSSYVESTVRFSFGRQTSVGDVDRAAQTFVEVLNNF
jgi:cysteine desulfurase